MTTKLPGFVIADLYKNTLVITGDEADLQRKPSVQVTQNQLLPPPETVQAAQKKWFLGDNKKGIVIVLNDTEAVHINDEWLNTLTKLLGGLKVDMGDIAIVNTHNHPITFIEIKEQLQARHVIVFGISMQQLKLPFTIPDYRLQSYAACTIVTAPAITLVAAEKTTESIKAEKRKLWATLQRVGF